jgi:hypothetical protein
MPYDEIAELPKGVKENVLKHAQYLHRKPITILGGISLRGRTPHQVA